jgi:hypothetical protein
VKVGDQEVFFSGLLGPLRRLGVKMDPHIGTENIEMSNSIP